MGILSDPNTQLKIRRFKKVKRGYFSFLILSSFILLSLFAELMIHKRALFVEYQGKFYFPTYGAIIPGTTFGFDYTYETNYRDLKKKLEADNSGSVILPFIPYDPFENDFQEGVYPPTAPDFSRSHYLGTDSSGRDVLARLVYGFRIAILFSLVLLVFNYIIGIIIGSLMGFYGGWIDLIGQRILEIWSNIPFLYIVIILSTLIVPNFFSLILIMVLFGWMGMASFMRTATYEQKARDYVAAAKSIGASDRRMMFFHILPNSVSVIITFIPFQIVSAISSLTALDFLGFGLPAPTPSWGELLKQGIDNLESYWISLSVIIAMVIILVMVTFIGEAIREAFNPRTHIVYR